MRTDNKNVVEQANQKDGHPRGLVHAIHMRINNGERKTIGEWADEYGVPVDVLRRRLSYSRKHGRILHPLTPYGGRVAEPLVDLMENESDYYVAVGAYDQALLSRMLAAFRLLELGFDEYPGLRPKLRKQIESITRGADDGSRTILLSEQKGT